MWSSDRLEGQGGGGDGTVPLMYCTQVRTAVKPYPRILNVDVEKAQVGMYEKQ